jgi:hypothetical protein
VKLFFAESHTICLNAERESIGEDSGYSVGEDTDHGTNSERETVGEDTDHGAKYFPLFVV